MAAAKHLEAAVLSAIRPAFPLVPTLLRPGVPVPPMRRREWGLFLGEFAISVYEWAGNLRSWRASTRQRQSTVAALSVLQNGLNVLSSSPGITGRAEAATSVLDVEFQGFVREFACSEGRRQQADPLSGLDEQQLGYLDDRLGVLRRVLLGDWRRLTEHSRGLVHTDFTPGNCGYDDIDVLTMVFDFESVCLGVLPLCGAKAIGAFCISPETAPGEVVALSPPPGLTLPLLRVSYLDTVRRQLAARKQNPVRRWGFLREDLRNLRWLDGHASSVAAI